MIDFMGGGPGSILLFLDQNLYTHHISIFGCSGAGKQC